MTSTRRTVIFRFSAMPAAESLAVRCRVDEPCGDPPSVDHEASHLPPGVGVGANNGSQLGRASIPARDRVHAVSRDESMEEAGAPA
jgi:hypothetical protein